MNDPNTHTAARDMAERPAFSVVVPVYGCARCLEKLCARLSATMAAITSRYEIILVDDRSPDGAWDNVLDLQRTYPAVRGIRLSRNFGQQIAIAAGLAHAVGDICVVMDCDLQDPPELIVDMYVKYLEGYDLILARRARRGHSAWRVFFARLYFQFMSLLTETQMDGNYGTFSLLSRKVVDAFLRFRERDRHYIFVLRWLGFRVGTVEYHQHSREIGKSSYTFRSLLRHALGGVIFQTTTLLRWIVGLGLGFAVMGLLLAIYLSYRQIMFGSVPGWTSLAVLILISTGVILVSLGTVGLYVGKIFEQVKDRPLFVVDRISERANKW